MTFWDRSKPSRGQNKQFPRGDHGPMRKGRGRWRGTNTSSMTNELRGIAFPDVPQYQRSSNPWEEEEEWNGYSGAQITCSPNRIREEEKMFRSPREHRPERHNLDEQLRLCEIAPDTAFLHKKNPWEDEGNERSTPCDVIFDSWETPLNKRQTHCSNNKNWESKMRCNHTLLESRSDHANFFQSRHVNQRPARNHGRNKRYRKQPSTNDESCGTKVEIFSLDDHNDAMCISNVKTDHTRYTNFGEREFQIAKTAQDEETKAPSSSVTCNTVSFGKKRGNRNNKKNATNDSICPTSGCLSKELSRDDPLTSGADTVLTDQMKPTKSVFAAKLAPANRAGFDKELLVTNHFEVRLNPIQRIYRYDVDLSLVIEKHEGRKEVNLCKGASDDSSTTRRHALVRAALLHALEVYRILSEHGAFVYDDASILFTNECLNATLKPHNGSLSVPISELNIEIRSLIVSDNATELIIRIQPCRDFAAQFDLGNAQKSLSESKTDRPLRNFLELLTNQDAVNRKAYICYGAGEMILNDPQFEKPIGKNSGYVYRKGVKKGIRFIQGHSVKKSDHSLVAALILDASLSTFYISDHLLTIMCEINGWCNPNNASWDHRAREIACKYLRNVRLRFTYRSGDFIAFSISNEPLKDLVEEDSELKVRFSAMSKYIGQKICYPNWPAVIQKTQRGNIFHSMEMLLLSENQRVPLYKQSDRKPLAERPHVRWDNILNHMKALNLMGGENQLMCRFGVCINPVPMIVEGFRRVAPQIKYDNVCVVVDKNKMNWKTRGTKFEVGGKIDVLFYTYDSSKGAPHIECRKKIVSEALQKGVHIKKVINTEMNLEFELKNRFSDESVFVKAESFAKNGQNVLIIYVDSETRKTHGKLKLLEACCQITTQHLTSEVARKIATGSPTTLEMFLMKLNCKSLGVNYTVVPDKFIKSTIMNKALIIGLDVAHPTGLSAGQTSMGYISAFPSVVGFSANCTTHSELFVGDYAYQEPLKEKIDTGLLISQMQRILTTWKKNRGSLPQDIWIIRDGVSEGQYDMVITEELSAIQGGCSKFHHKYRPRFALIVVTKRHNKRFFKKIGKNIENPKVGTVVDIDVVRPDMTEFFMLSHTTIQGTAKASAYNLLKSDMPELTQDTLQPLMMALCFGHQVCTSPISIPEPVYQADEWAKRGNDVFKAYKELGFKVPRKGGDDNNSHAKYDWNVITERLSYKGKRLEFTRVNA